MPNQSNLAKGSREHDEEIIEMYAAGYSMMAISKSIGISADAVRRRLRWANVEIRPQNVGGRPKPNKIRDEALFWWNKGLYVYEIVEKVGRTKSTVSYHLKRAGVQDLRMRKTCRHGHLLTPENTTLNKDHPKWRRCKKCRAKYNRISRERAKAKLEAGL